jgi:hypothetical protein
MTDELAVLLEEFPGSANRTRCFTHILNLVAKGILKQFDLPKGKASEALDAVAKGIAQLAKETQKEKLSAEDFSDEDDDDNEEGLTDIREKMSEKDVLDLDKRFQPIRLVLVKVSGLNFTLLLMTKNFSQLRKLAFTIKNSTTAVLPEWFSILEKHIDASKKSNKTPLSIHMMPCDVATRWNSTFDMLEFALLYRKPLDDLTNNREMKLRSYELSEEEWIIAEQLAGILKVRYHLISYLDLL